MVDAKSGTHEGMTELDKLIRTFAKRLRALAPRGRIPAEWKKRVQHALATGPGNIPPQDDNLSLALAEWTRARDEERSRVTRGKKRSRAVQSQKDLARTLKVTPKSLQRAVKKNRLALELTEVLSEEQQKFIAQRDRKHKRIIELARPKRKRATRTPPP